MLYLINLFPVLSLCGLYRTLNQKQLEAINEEEKNLKLALEPLITEYNIKNVNIITTSRLGASAAGCRLFNQFNKRIRVNLQLCKIDFEAAKAVAKHELGHMIHNHKIKKVCLTLVSSVAMSILFPKINLSGFKGLATAFVAMLAIQMIFAKSKEAEADNFALEHSTEEEIKGNIRFFTAELENQERLCKKLGLTDSPAYLLTPVHPTTQSRVDKFKAGFFKKTGQAYIEGEAERQKIAQIAHHSTK